MHPGPDLLPGARLAAQATLWLVALCWIARVASAHFGLPRIPNLLLPEHDLLPPGAPTLTVIVPACNEQSNISACLQSLIAQDYPHLQILAVNDRSTDRTGELMDVLAARHPTRLRVLHIAHLPPGWLGKTHAMASAAREASSDFLLFTDADVLFRPDALRRALANAVATAADHFVLVPTTIIHRWDEAALLAFFQIFGIWGPRPWRVRNPRTRDAIGIGAFNLIRASAYRQIGGFEALPMEIVEDLGLARRIKPAGLTPGIAFGRGLVSLHWASGFQGLINVMTKNVFSIFNFHGTLLLAACCWLLLFAIVPFVVVLSPAVFVPASAVPAALTILAVAYGYVLMGRPSGLSPWNFLLAPFAAALFIFTMCRSMVITLRQGGVVWRGTFYPLAELRRNAAPLIPPKG